VVNDPASTDDVAWSRESLATPHATPDKAGRVRRMFNDIAPRYELVNSLFSAGRDARWRSRAVQLARVEHTDSVLDVACGTGDFARAFGRGGAQAVTGCDFAHEMLTRAVGSTTTPADNGSTAHLGWCEADAMKLPFADSTFSIVSCAFGVRNFGQLEVGLAEMHRVMRAGGRLVILEFTRPTNRLFRRLFELYSNRIMPAAATLVSGDRSGAYRYLPRSVVSFLTADQMVETLRRGGFCDPTATPLTMGVVTVYVATRS
jgi:demethylmenaquinone methyltransferase/2-methoxy-6-polyprenyl-1,4-benzoquinol methylase